MMHISFVTPLYKSAHTVTELCDRARATITALTPDYEIILVNDGSPDDSLNVARKIAANDPHVRVIDLSRNYGQHPALMTGLEKSTGNYVFICDSDLEEEPEWIAAFLTRLKENDDCDVVYGVQQARKGNVFYRAARRVFYRTLNWVSGIEFPADIITARLMTRRYVDAVLQFRERELFAAGVWHMAGFRQIPYLVNKPPRDDTTYTFRKLVGLFVNAITAFSVRPLQAISIVGVVLLLFAIILIVYLVFQRLSGNVLHGWTSVIASTLLIGGVTLFFNGVMAIYLAKVFLEVKRRPLTIIREDINSGPPPALKKDGDYRAIVSHYEGRLAEHGTGPKAVDWKDEQAATTRYDVMLDLLPKTQEPVTLLDFGCGLGGLKQHIQARGLDHIHYEGLDVSPAYAEAARKALPGTTIHCFDILETPGALGQYDYIVMNGVFTRRQDMTEAQMFAYLERLGGAVFAHARQGLAFNVMSMHVDWKEETLFHPDTSALARVVSRALSRHMVLRDDYGLYECTCYAYTAATMKKEA
jgi:putative glycosyltransferase